MSKRRLVRAAARDSPLSLAQVEEVRSLYPHIDFEMRFLKTRGDLDQKTSLRLMEKSNFFTKEIDELVVNGICDVGIHSAKDLPEPLLEGLLLFALTEGVDPSDSLLLKEELREGMVIATSSKRREMAVAAMCPGLLFVDVRGNIEKRIALWERGEYDGLVIAEAALLRLGLTHLPRRTIPGETHPLQGKLAIVGREGAHETLSWFR